MAQEAERSIEEWIANFESLYGRADQKRSAVDLWIGVTAHATAIGEAIRRMHFADLMDSAAHAFCWMCSFVAGCRRREGSLYYLSPDESFSEIVALKYPDWCGHCTKEQCVCNPRDTDAGKNKAARYGRLLERRDELIVGRNPVDFRSRSVEDWVAKFGHIFGGNTHILGFDAIGFHFLEECGEALAAIRGLEHLEGIPSLRPDVADQDLLLRLGTVKGIVEEYTTHEATIKKLDGDDPQERAKAYRDATPTYLQARMARDKMGMIVELADTFSWFCCVLAKVEAVAANCSQRPQTAERRCWFHCEPFEQALRDEYLPTGSVQCPTCLDPECKCVFVMPSEGSLGVDDRSG